MKFNRILSVLSLLGLLAASGCAHYKVGSIAHPQLKTVAVGTVDNETREPMLETVLKQKLPMRFMTEGSMKLVPSDDADAIVNARVKKVVIRTRGYTENDDSNDDDSERIFRGSIYGAVVTVEYDVTRPGRVAPVIPATTVVGRALFAQEHDLSQNRQQAISVALSDAADQIVTGLTEGF